MRTYVNVNGRFIRRASSAVSFPDEGDFTIIEGYHTDKEYLPSGQTEMQALNTFSFTTLIDGVAADINDLTLTTGQVLRIENIPTDTQVIYDGNSESVGNDDYVEWSSLTSGDIEFRFFHTAHQELSVYATVTAA